MDDDAGEPDNGWMKEQVSRRMDQGGMNGLFSVRVELEPSSV